MNIGLWQYGCVTICNNVGFVTIQQPGWRFNEDTFNKPARYQINHFLPCSQFELKATEDPLPVSIRFVMLQASFDKIESEFCNERNGRRISGSSYGFLMFSVFEIMTQKHCLRWQLLFPSQLETVPCIPKKTPAALFMLSQTFIALQ